MKNIDIDDLLALDALHAACVHLKKQFSIQMTRDEAQANLESRAVLFRCSNRILAEFGAGVTREEVGGALILERELGLPDERNT